MMRKRICALYFLWGFIALLGCVAAQGEPRILIVGDSWAQGIWAGNLMDKAMETTGLGDVDSIGQSCALGGTKAEQWVRPEFRAKIAQALQENPSVDMIHLVIGGNDVLARIKEQNVFEVWTENKRLREWDLIAWNVKRIVLFCLEFEQIRHVILAGYDYLNASTAREVMAILGQEFHFGGMSQSQVNQCFIEVEQRKCQAVFSMKNCTYIHNLGLLQHHFNTPENVPPPGGPPEYVPFPGGDPHYPMPDAAFIRVSFEGREFAGDGIHPSDEAHLIMLQNSITCCYRALLAEPGESSSIIGCARRRGLRLPCYNRKQSD